VGIFALGILVGMLAAGVVMVVVMRSRMIQVTASPLGFDETLEALDRGVEAAEGWSSPGKRDLNAMMRKHGVEFTPRVTLVEVCKAPYAKEVLSDDRRMATLMPCALAVYEDNDGKVWISKMNTGLMGRVFGGTVGRVMAGLVSKEETTILSAIEGGAKGG
jgi:uncharacterized protein (DUF302 family)